MTRLAMAVLMLAGPQAQDAPRVAEMPAQVCFDAQRAIFQVSNPGPVPLLVTLSVERWSDDGDAAAWTLFHEDITQKEARAKKPRSLELEARGRRDVSWALKQRVGPPPLATGRYRLVAVFVTRAGEPAGKVTHEFVIQDCR